MKRKVIIRHTLGGTTTKRIWETAKENLDLGQQMTQDRYLDTALELRKVYEQAAEDLYAKQQSFLHAHEERVRKYQAQLKAGEITQADYEAWMRGQVFQEKAWAQKREQIAQTMVDIDRRAQEIVNTGRLDVFADNANYIAYSLETGAGADLGFGLYDSDAVMRLVKDKPDLLPLPEVDEGKDYAWYNKVINNSITQGIIQGEDLEEIVFRIATQTGETALAGMRRNARTAFTGAQNAGRVEGMRQAKGKGIDVKKRWMSFLDSHVRDTHADADGQVVDVDEPFQLSDGDVLMYPCDPAGKPRNVYNCRCKAVPYYPKYGFGIDRVDEDGEVIRNMTYREWERMKKGEGETLKQEANESPQTPEIRETLIGAYNYHSEHNGLKRNTANDSIAFAEKMGNPSQFDADLSKLDEAGRENIARAASELCSQYDTPLSTVGTMSGEEALGNRAFAVTRHNYETDTAEILINPLKCRNTDQMVERLDELRDKGYLPKGVRDEQLGEYIFTHEFGHSLINMEQPLDNKRNWANADYGKIRSARREIDKIYDEYAREVGRLDSERKAAEMDFMLNLDMAAAEKAKKLQAELDRVKVSTYSLTNSDEFVAESFAATRFDATDSPYARRCADVLDKYFRR